MAQPSTTTYTHPDCAYSSAALMDFRKRKVEYRQTDLSKQAYQIPPPLEPTGTPPSWNCPAATGSRR